MIEFTYVILSHRNCLEKKFMKLFEKRNIPWAHVFGNHDNNIGMNNEEQQPAYERFADRSRDERPARLI